MKTWGDSATITICSGCLHPALRETYSIWHLLYQTTKSQLFSSSICKTTLHFGYLSTVLKITYKQHQFKHYREHCIMLCYNIIGAKFLQACLRIQLKLGVYATQFFLSLNAAKILKNACLRSSTVFRWKYMGGRKLNNIKTMRRILCTNSNTSILLYTNSY